MKKIIFFLIGAFISINAHSQSCPGITVTGTTKAKVFHSCYDTVGIYSKLKKVDADTISIANSLNMQGDIDLSGYVIDSCGQISGYGRDYISFAYPYGIYVGSDSVLSVTTPKMDLISDTIAVGGVLDMKGNKINNVSSVTDANNHAIIDVSAGLINDRDGTPVYDIYNRILYSTSGGPMIYFSNYVNGFGITNAGSSGFGYIKNSLITGSKTFQLPNATGTFVLNDNTAALTNKTYNGVVLSGSSTPTLAVTGTTTISGTNTGDQTTITGNAGTATNLTIGRTISLTSDVNYTSPTFDGSSNVTATSTVTWVNGKPTYDTTYAFKFRTITKSSTYTAVPGDFIACNNTSGSFTITLPSAPLEGARVGAKLTVQSGTNTITISTSGSDVFNKISGGTSLILTLLNQAINLQYNHSIGVWYVVGDNLTLSSLDARYTNQNTTGMAATINSAPTYFYTGSKFYRSRIGVSTLSPFINTTPATNSPTNICMIGDSRMGYSTPVISNKIGQYNKLNSLGFVEFNGATIYGTDISFVNTGTAATLTRNDSTTSANWGINGSRADATTGAVFTITPATKYRFNAFSLWYNKTSGGGDFTYTIDGGSATTVHTNAVSDSLGTFTVSTGLTNGATHTIVITVTSGSVRLYGIDFANNLQTGFIVHILHSGGSKASQWAGNNLAYTKKFIAVKNPVLCTFWLGANDAGVVTPPSSTAYINWMKAIIKNVNLPNKCAPVVVSDYFRCSAANRAIVDTVYKTAVMGYRDKLIQAVADSGYSMFDLQTYWPTHSEAFADSLFDTNDIIHPSTIGADYIWTGLIQAIMPSLYNEAMAGLTSFKRTSTLVPGDGVTGFGAITQISTGLQSEAFTGHYFPSSSEMTFLSGNSKYLHYMLGSAIVTAYPTSTKAQVLFGYRQGSTAAKAFDLSVNSDGSTSITTNNSFVATTATSSRFSSKVYIGGIATTPTASLHLAAGSATAGTAPIKTTRSALLTVAEQGAWENGLNGRIFFTPSTLRKNIPVSDTSVASNGKILIGNGTDYTVANITQGINTIITNGSGTITIDADTSNGATKLATQGDITRATAALVRGASFSGSGTATTTFTVTIGATQANSTYKVTATPSNVLSAAVFYINNKTTTTFDVVYLTGLTGTVAFDWILVP